MTQPAHPAPDATGATDAPGTPDWESSLAQGYGVLLGHPLTEHDPDAEYGAFYGGDWLDETEVDRDASWLAPAALAGRETVSHDTILLLDETGFDPPRFDASRSFFEVFPDEAPAVLAGDLAAAGAAGAGAVRGDELARLLDRHGLGPAELPTAAWRVRQARIASDGTLLGALRAATGVPGGPDGLVPHVAGPWRMESAREADRTVAAVAHPGLRAHLRTFCEPGSHTLDHQTERTGERDGSGHRAGEWNGVGTLVTQWLGAVDQYEISVVRLTGPTDGDRDGRAG
ncbi:hypothetical protein JNUCC64_20055 [Streptomyces sp. JNUCC 64]